MKNKLIIGALIIGFLGLAAAPALAVATPAKSVVNPYTNTVYLPNNSASPAIDVYNSAWSKVTTLALPARSFGLAVYQTTASDGKLLISINNGTGSILRYYKLDASGLPTGTPKDVYITDLGTSIKGVTIAANGSDLTAFLANDGSGYLYTIKYNAASDSWTGLTATDSDYYLTDIAVTAPNSGQSLVFVSEKNSSGKIEIFSYNWSANSLTEVGGVTGLYTPTYLKLNSAGSRLYVAVNGPSGGDIVAYNVSANAPYLYSPVTVASIPYSYGWSGLDANDSYLYFSQVQNASENQTKIYKIALPLTSSKTVTDADLVGSVLAKNIDGLALKKDGSALATTYSGDGSLTTITLGSVTPPVNQPPVLSNLVQYQDNYTTVIQPGGLATGPNVYCTYNISDPDNDLMSATLSYRLNTGSGWPTSWTVVGTGNNLPSGPQGSTVSSRTNGQYEWKVDLTDSAGHTATAYYNNDSLTADFVVAADTTPPSQVINLNATSGQDGVVPLSWNNPSDSDLAEVIIVRNTGSYPAINASGTPTSGSKIYDNTSPVAGVYGSTVDSGLANKTLYYYAVFSRDAKNNWNTAVVSTGSSKNAATATPDDTTPPAAITNLVAVAGTNAGEVKLTWTAPGDDGMTGTVSGYRVRYITSTTPLTNAFSTGFEDYRATEYSSAAYWTSFAAGNTPENRVLANISHQSGVPTYIYVAVIAKDNIPNWGTISNIAQSFVKDNFGTPTISVIYPTKAPVNTTQTIVIEGSGFWGTPTLQLTSNTAGINPINAVLVSMEGSSKLVYSFFTSSTVGTRNVIVANPDGQSVTSANAYNIIASGSDTTPPAQIINFTCVDFQDAKVPYSWTNAADNDLAQVIVKRSNIAGEFPRSHNFGDTVYDSSIPLRPGSTTASTDLNVVNGTTYRYAVFSKDTSGNWNDSVAANPPGGNVNADTGTPGIPLVSVTTIEPNNGAQTATVPVINLLGTGFKSGATVKLTRYGQVDISATNVNVFDAKTISCLLPLGNAPAGQWNVVVTNTDATSGYLTNGFTIYAPGTAPVVKSINPSVAQRNNTVNVTISGERFVSGATVVLARTGQPDIKTTGTVAVSGGNTITCSFALPVDAQVGLWSVLVTNPDQQTGILYNGFSIVSNINVIPVIAQVYPSRAPNSSTTSVMIIGQRFSSVSAVDLQTIPASSLTYNIISDTQMLATVSSGKPVGVFHLTASNVAGTSGQTAADTFEVTNGNENPSIPSQVQNLTAEAGDKQAKLRWTNPTDNDMASLELRRYTGAFPTDSNTAGGTLVKPAYIPAPGATNEVVDSGLTNGTTYYYVTFIKDTSGNWSVVQINKNAVSATPGTGKTIKIVGPNGGETWEVGSQHDITWETTGTIANVTIEVSYNNKSTWTTITTEANDGSSTWTVTGNPTTDAFIRVKDAAGVASDESDAKFTIKAGTATTISDLNIVRNGDTVNSSVTVNWQTQPVNAPVDIYTKTGAFSTNAAEWQKLPQSVILGTYPDANQVGNGTSKYYKLMPATVPLQNSDLTQEVVGKFDLHVAVQAGKGGLYAASVPFEISSSQITSVIGKQLTGANNEGDADRIWSWNETTQDWAYAWLVDTVGQQPQYDGHWFSNVSDTTLTIGADKAFFIQIRDGHNEKNITLVGKIPNANRTIAVNPGASTAFLGFISTPYPINASLMSSNLGNYATGAMNEGDADRVWSWNETTQDWEYAWLVNTNGQQPQYDGHWFTNVSETAINFTPGKGYFVQVRGGHNGFTWTYPKAY